MEEPLFVVREVPADVLFDWLEDPREPLDALPERVFEEPADGVDLPEDPLDELRDEFAEELEPDRELRPVDWLDVRVWFRLETALLPLDLCCDREEVERFCEERD